MLLRAFRRLAVQNTFKYFEIMEGIGSPAARLTGYHTCHTVSIGTLSCPMSPLHHSKYGHAGIVTPWTTSIRNKRKLYPEPIEEDPEYFLLPREPNTRPDLNYIPELNNNGPELVKKIHDVVKTDKMGRLFAVIHIDGEQRKVTTEDLVVVSGFFPPQIGDKIRLEKVMALGSKDFTLLGRPLLDRDLVKVEATVIEKTVSHVKIHYTQKKRFRRLKLTQTPTTVLVINSVQMNPAALT